MQLLTLHLDTGTCMKSNRLVVESTASHVHMPVQLCDLSELFPALERASHTSLLVKV